MELEVLEQELTVCKVDSLPEAMWSGGLCFVGMTDEEFSLVCETRHVPRDTLAREDGWRALRVVGTLDFSLTGILASLSTTLAHAGVSVFALSTYNTDYILVKREDLPQAIRALEEAGHVFVNETAGEAVANETAGEAG